MPPAARLPPNSFFCRELPSAGVFIPHSSVDRIRYSGESPMNQTWARLLHIAQIPPILCFRVAGNCPGFVYIPRLHALPGLLGWPRRGRVNSPHYTAEALRFFRSPLRQELSFCVLTPAQDHAQPCVALPAYWLGAYGSSDTLTRLDCLIHPAAKFRRDLAPRLTVTLESTHR